MILTRMGTALSESMICMRYPFWSQLEAPSFASFCLDELFPDQGVGGRRPYQRARILGDSLLAFIKMHY